METIFDILLYLFIIGVPVMIGGAAIYGIHSKVVKNRRANARLIWRRICEHRQHSHIQA